ncbi:cytochrome P450 [Actinosynnema sp. NPDC053489]|uniref:cytochrome P450 n=1 Tax=Actinosynnema sp. NPDC053489 TaxID=3363916 RepID=UPI0037C89CFF
MAVLPEPRPYPFEPFAGELSPELIGMVETDPVSRVLLPDGEPAWLVLDYAGCVKVLADPRFSRVLHPPPPDRPPLRDLNQDGAAHAAVRRVGNRAFGGRRMAHYRPRVRALVDELVDAMIAGPRPADLIGGLVAPLPLLVICEVIGVPATDRERFHGWLAGLNSVVDYNSADAARSLWAYLAEQLAAKRAEPGDDLLSVWLDGDDHGLSDEEIIMLAMGLLRGGLEVGSTAAGVRVLFQHPEQLAELVRSPEKVAAAVDEILRYTAVSSMFRVQVVTDDVTVGDVAMSAGDRVMAVPWAANRDPRVFDDPNAFDIDRVARTAHLAFGYGPHFCLGTALARMEVELSIATLLRRLPGLAPAIPVGELRWRHDRINGGIEEFPVVWRDDQ